MPQNQAIRIDGFSLADPASMMKVVTLPIPEPKEGEALVKILLRPVNPADILGLRGVYPGFAPAQFPAVPGLEGMGVVEKLGAGCTKVSVGQRVTASQWSDKTEGRGTWQTYLTVPERQLVPVPDAVSDEAAAQFLVNPVTAYGMLKNLEVPAGESVLITAAGSVLGRMLIELCKHFGYKSLAVVRRRAAVNELKELGASAVICTADEDLVARVKAETGGKGAWGALDCIAGETTGLCAQAVRNGGTVYVYGVLGGTNVVAGVPDLLFRDVRLRGWWLSQYLGLSMTHEQAVQVCSEVMGLLAKAVIKPFTGTIYKLEDAAKAVVDSETEGRGGKILLK